MNKEQVEQVRTLADALANYIATENDKSFFRRFATVSKYYQLRLLLIKANTEYARLGNAPFLTLDNFLGVFEEGEEIAYSNWDLSRDLVLIRLVEQLHASGWLSHHQDELDAIADQHDAVLEKEIEEREGTIGE
ncbi:MAG: hypothetical protein H6638_04340 [Ardenticatenales bacterium]|nr:hypothetical protein [Ardenticatenales bacterium]